MMVFISLVLVRIGQSDSLTVLRIYVSGLGSDRSVLS